MRKGLGRLSVIAVVAAILAVATTAPALADKDDRRSGRHFDQSVELGPRPFYLVDKLGPGRLKSRLEQCEGPFKPHKFSIGHRGAALQFPEHTKESYRAAARMGAGIIECDVTFTNDGELVCRHAQSDLHTTTDIRLNPDKAGLADKCGTTTGNPNVCSASDLTVDEFKRLKGKMDAAGATADFRTDLYSTGATLLTHKESIKLIDKLGRDFTPELKSADVSFPFSRFNSQEDYARAMIEEYIQAGISPKRVWPQSFNLDDVLYWIDHFPRFGRQAVFLDPRDSSVDPTDPDDPGVDPRDPNQPLTLQDIADLSVRVIAPPMWYLLTVEDGNVVPSKYAEAAKKAGLKIISWTTERSGRIDEEVLQNPQANGYYYQSTLSALENDGDILNNIDVLAREVGIIGLFSDWPATTTFYANCMLGKSSGKRGK